MKKDVSIVLVGLGGYASIYVNSILDNNIPNIRLAGLVDPFPQGCPRLEELRSLNAPLYSSIDDFYSEHTADLAVISTPIQFHTQQIITALEHGSNVLCEKPLCGDKNDIEKMLDARHKSGKFADIGYQWSHNKGILEMKRDILSGLYGAPKALKSLTLWPRDTAYFKRGSGWAGTIRAKDGSLVYDSVANNATAHYLHNMFFILGKTMDSALAPIETDAFLLRANPIENFDACTIRCKMPGNVDVLFVAAHSIETNVGPVCEYVFEKGTIRLDPLSGDETAHDLKGHFVGVLENGEVKDYGNPHLGTNEKLFLAIEAAREGAAICCPIEAAAVHTRVINDIQENFEIHSAKRDLIKIDEKNLVYVDGLGEALTDIYRGKNIDLSRFCE